MLVFRVGAAEVEVAFVVNDEGWYAASHRMVGEFFEAGIPEAADGVPWLEVGSDEVAPLASDGVGGMILGLVSSIGGSESGGPVDDGEASALVHEFLETIEMTIGGVGAPSVGVDDEGVLLKKCFLVGPFADDLDFNGQGGFAHAFGKNRGAPEVLMRSPTVAVASGEEEDFLFGGIGFGSIADPEKVFGGKFEGA